MANFPPFKKHIINLIEEMIDIHGLSGPFLDIGCGIGDISLPLAKRGLAGEAIDFSATAINEAKKNLQPYRVDTRVADLFEIKQQFKLIILTTVIEHIKEDTRALKHLRSCLPAEPGQGHLILSMPINPKKEWRWDDDFYGHYRRYDQHELVQQLQTCGFRVIEFWDYTWPVFWLMRRLYTKILPRKLPQEAIKESNTAASSLHSAWEIGCGSRLLSRLPVWSLVYAIQRPWRKKLRGFEAIILAQTI